MSKELFTLLKWKNIRVQLNFIEKSMLQQGFKSEWVKILFDCK